MRGWETRRKTILKKASDRGNSDLKSISERRWTSRIQFLVKVPSHCLLKATLQEFIGLFEALFLAAIIVRHPPAHTRMTVNLNIVMNIITKMNRKYNSLIKPSKLDPTDKATKLTCSMEDFLLLLGLTGQMFGRTKACFHACRGKKWSLSKVYQHGC